MSGRIILLSTAMGLALAAAAGAAPASKKAAPGAADARQPVMDCSAHKFETVVTEIVDGQPHQSKVKLCGKDGQTDSEWIATLKDAVAKLDANKQVEPAVRKQIETAIEGEITRLEIPAATALASNNGFTARNPLPGGISALPQDHGSGAADGLPPPRAIISAPPRSEYAALPPLPTAPPPPPHVLAGDASLSAAPLPKPRMSLTCFADTGAEGPCSGFTRDTVITVHAGEDLPAGTSLRFVRDGDTTADIQLAQLKKGRSVQLAVPAELCRHVVGGSLEIRIVRAGQEVSSDGPYNLNC